MTVGLCSIVRLPALSFDYVGIWSQVIASPMSCIWARMGKSFIFVSPIGTKNRVLMSFSSTRYRSLGSFHALRCNLGDELIWKPSELQEQ